MHDTKTNTNNNLHKHKKQCEEHLQRVAKLYDEKLFKQPSQLEDCPICMIQLPTLESGRTYMSCCGKVICDGCIHAVQSRAAKEEDDVCPFCRTPPPEDEELVQRYEKRLELDDALAIHNMGCHYAEGQLELPQNMAKALEFWHQAADLGHARAYTNIGNAYLDGRGVEVDMKEAVHYWELAAMGGNAEARRNLGINEWEVGNMDRALKHWMIAVKNGDAESLRNIKRVFKDGHATKDDYAKALRSYQVYLDLIKSDQRDKAAAANDSPYYDSG